ncbi:MAG TPA: hypothetical protein VFZ41_02095 [Solirubrobacterales bacterium]
MTGGFKRSSWFGVIGVMVVMAAVAVIGLTMGSGEVEDPKPIYALIFGILAVFFIILFALQRADLNRASTASVRGAQRAVVEGREIENPATMPEPDLWAALAVQPIDDEAIKARSQAWDIGRRSQGLGMLVTLLIFLTVPPIYLLESFVPLLIGGPLIVLAALYGAFRAIAPGGDMERGYETVGKSMGPLGLAVTERPTVSIEMREPVTPRMGPKVHGDLVLSGERHGRSVSARLGGGRSEVAVGVAAPEFHAKARDGKVRPDKGTATEIAEALKSVPASTRWKRVEVTGGPEGILVARKGGEQSDWMCDLWLAEHLASTC